MDGTISIYFCKRGNASFMENRIDIERLCALAKLEIFEGQKERLSSDLSEMVAFAGTVCSLDITESGGAWEGCSLRSDTQGLSLSRESALSNAPERAEGFFAVPNFLN